MKRFAAALFLAFLISPALAADDTLSPAANAAFLAANARKPGVTVRPNGLQYRALHNGFGRHPTLADTAEVSYTVKLINGKLVDSVSPELPASLAVSNVMRGLNEALLLMEPGDRWEVVVPTELAFGGKGSPNGVVPPNQTLVFDLSLIAILPPAPQAQTQSGTGVSVYSFNRGINDRETGAMFTLQQ